MTPIQQLLALADEELSTAQLLLDNDRFRAAISRAYYSMYHATQAASKAVPRQSLRTRARLPLGIGGQIKYLYEAVDGWMGR